MLIYFNEVMWEIYGIFITMGELACINANHWVNNVVKEFVIYEIIYKFILKL